jgi:ATP-dependent exoDNAse (exonuclease V) beta subunit
MPPSVLLQEDSIKAREFIAEKYLFTFVDEAQDTSRLQFEVLCLIAEAASTVHPAINNYRLGKLNAARTALVAKGRRGPYICFIGDSQQSIFSFQGADVSDSFCEGI